MIIKDLIIELLECQKDCRIDFVVKDDRENVIDANEFEINKTQTYIEFIIETDKFTELKDIIKDLENKIEELNDEIELLEEDIETKETEIEELKNN